jgi:peptidoglycan/xylan/chitin deacetylase (PgdA/CDA1 family)
MPSRVRIRVSLYALLGVSLAALPWGFVEIGSRLSFAWTTLVLGFGTYLTWCFWPRWTFGLASDPLALLPETPGQAIRLSFDDGPTPGLTDRILDLLAEQGMKASFFVLLMKARAQPDLIRRIVAEGHFLGLHGEDHRAPFFRGAGELRASLDRARAELEELAGRPVTLYRPSHGWKNLALLIALRPLPLEICTWHAGVWDTDAPPADVLTARLLSVTPRTVMPVTPIVLLHDGLGDEGAVPQHADALLESLRRWLPATRSAA